jgi:hypothetical protein
MGVIKILIFRCLSVVPLGAKGLLLRIGTFWQNLVAVVFQFRSAYRNTQLFPDRESLWRFAFESIGRDQEVVVLEFGVWKGDSLKHFAELNCNEKTALFGFDSFEGLPEEWVTSFNSWDKGHFSTGGRLPEIRDRRVQFVKGWFHQTLPRFLEQHPLTGKPVLVHLDADLYSSTLFVLTQLWGKLSSFYFICDEWTGGEALALMNFQQAYPCHIEFFGRALSRNKIPCQVLGRIDFALSAAEV